MRGGVFGVDGDHNFVMIYNTEGMARGIASDRLEPSVKVY